MCIAHLHPTLPEPPLHRPRCGTDLLTDPRQAQPCLIQPNGLIDLV